MSIFISTHLDILFNEEEFDAWALEVARMIEADNLLYNLSSSDEADVELGFPCKKK